VLLVPQYVILTKLGWMREAWNSKLSSDLPKV